MWTKSQKLSAAVLGLAVVAFGVDRWVLPAPDGAGGGGDDSSSLVVSRGSAAPSTPRVAAGPDAAKAGPTAAGTPGAAQVVTLASRLAAIAEARGFAFDGTGGDAFRPADAWLDAADPVKVAAAAAAAPATPAKPAAAAPRKPAVKKVDHAALFRSGHALTAVMKKQDGGMAIVDGKLVALGQIVDGFKLTRVGLADATFTGKGTTVTLRIPGVQHPPRDPYADSR
jgi:hypothetical protein